MFDESDYWEEPTIADDIFIDAKHKLEDALKESIKMKIDDIKGREDSLKSRTLSVVKRERQVREREFKLENELTRDTSEFRQMGLREKFKIFNIKLFTIKRSQRFSDKCDLCDDDRYIKFKDPLGRDSSVKCTCSKYIYSYEPIEASVSNFTIGSTKGCDGDKFGLSCFWVKYEYEGKSDEYCSGNQVKETDIHTTFDPDIDEHRKRSQYSILYSDVEACQNHCVYLMSLN